MKLFDLLRWGFPIAMNTILKINFVKVSGVIQSFNRLMIKKNRFINSNAETLKYSKIIKH